MANFYKDPEDIIAQQDAEESGRIAEAEKARREAETTGNELLDGAIWTARNLGPIIPTAPCGEVNDKGKPSKEPCGRLVPHGSRDATTDEATIRRWYDEEPRANIGFVGASAKPPIFVIDIDVHDGVDGFANIAKAGYMLPDTLQAETPSGGKHYFYKWTQGEKPRQTQSNIRDNNGAKIFGVDVRGVNGYVVVSPSRTTAGQYKWLNDRFNNLAEFPEWAKRVGAKPKAAIAVQDKLPTSRRIEGDAAKNARLDAFLRGVTPQAKTSLSDDEKLRRATAYLAKMPPAVQGGDEEGMLGHDRLLYVCIRIAVGFDLDDATALKLLWSEYNPRCVPPWDPADDKELKDFERKVSEARKKSNEPPGFLLYAERPQKSIGAPDEPDVADAKVGSCEWRPLGSFPMPIPDRDNPNILVEGRWLERGGVSFFVSTSGTGKTTHSTQLAISMAEGVEFMGLKPRGRLNVLVIQSEDSDDRVGIDREDIIAYLSKQHPETDWRKTVDERVHFAGYDGLVGANFIQSLDEDLAKAEKAGNLPDVLMLNPLYDRLGGNQNDAQIVTAFFAGGEINRVTSVGLRAIARKYRIGVIVYAHTGKPPTGDELKKWLKSDFPEYQICGSSVITNFGRSFITMMKIPDHDGSFLFVAGKNGDGLGWKLTNGDYTRYRFGGWGEGVSSCGHGNAHYWRDFDEGEITELESDVLNVKPDDPTKRENDQGEESNARWLADAVIHGINANQPPVGNAKLREWGLKRWTKSVMRKAVTHFEAVRENQYGIGKEGGYYVLVK